MSWIRSAAITLLVAASGCKDAGPSLPVITYLSPENATHLGSRFSPDGSRVAYWAPGANGYDLVIARADLSGARTVSTQNAQVFGVVWSPDSRQLAFASSASNVADIFIVPADSGAPRQLTSAPGYEFPTSWSPRGNRITYGATREKEGLRGMLLDLATGQTSLLPNRDAPAGRWSPDGERLGLQALGGVGHLWVGDSVGGGSKQVTTEGQETSLAWSPDGTEIAYVSRRTGTGDIWVVPIDGGPARQLTRDIRDDATPQWSPDGKWIAFISQRGHQTDLWVVPAAGGQELRITDDTAEETNPQWVGERLAYQSGATGTSMWAVNVVSGEEQRLTPDSIEVGQMHPSPDGTEVAYEVIRGGGVSDLQVMPVTGGTARTIATGGSLNTEPSWSPDGKSIAFLSTRSGNWDVWVIGAAGSEPRRLTDFPTAELNPQWSPDGATIYFTSRWEAGPFSDLWTVPFAGGPPTRLTKVGTINGLAVSRVSPDVLVQSVGGKDGRPILARVQPDGKLVSLWERSNLTGYSWPGFTPTGDSVAINAELPDGVVGSYLISTRTGQGRQMLGPGDQIGDFSPDGRWLAYWSGGSAAFELGVVDMKDGSHRLLTTSPESETSYWWGPDNHTLFFTRQWQHRRIAIADLSRIRLPGPP